MEQETRVENEGEPNTMLPKRVGTTPSYQGLFTLKKTSQ